MRRIRVEKTRRTTRDDDRRSPMPLDPRDQDVLRAKRIASARERSAA